MRTVIFLIALTATPAAAWEFSPTPVCTLSHAEPGARLDVTYDVRAEEPYAITVTRTDAAWPEAPVFAMRFDGPRGLTISTNRHRLSEGGRAITVSDRGFGNVLDGLEFNATATAILGETELGFPLAGAAPEVQKFRDCTEGGVA
ncbi:MAG: excinuclease ABC subunit B [Pseudomonadota bacterium]